MPEPKTNTPVAALARAHKLARTDGWMVLIIAGTSAVFAAAFSKDAAIAIAGSLAAGAGALELHGAKLLASGLRRSVPLLVCSQLALLSIILGYAAWRWHAPELETIRAQITPEMREQLKLLNIPENTFLLVVARTTSLVLALVALLYQGGMALYYLIRRQAFAPALTED